MPVHVQRFLGALELGHLLDQPEFATNEARKQNREALRALIDQKIGTDTVEAWIERLNRAGVPCGRVFNLADVFSDPQVQSQEMVLEVDHPGHGPVRMTGFPIKFSETPARVHRPAPALGEHTDEVLRESRLQRRAHRGAQGPRRAVAPRRRQLPADSDHPTRQPPAAGCSEWLPIAGDAWRRRPGL